MSCECHSGVLIPAKLLAPQRPGRLVTQALLDWVVIAGCWMALAKLPGWSWPLWIVLIGGRVHALGVVLHDAVHMAPSQLGRGSARVVDWLAGYPSCSTVNATRFHHLRHHRHSCTEADPYFLGGLLKAKRRLGGQRAMYVAFWLRFILLVPWWSLRGYVGSLALVWPALRTRYTRLFLQDCSDRDWTHDAEVIACCRSDVGQAAAHTLVYAGAVVWPSAFLWGVAVPWTVAGMACGYRLLVEHRYELQAEATRATMLATTREHHVPVLYDLLLGPRNVGYHVTHHMHPSVAYQNLPALSAWYARGGK